MKRIHFDDIPTRPMLETKLRVKWIFCYSFDLVFFIICFCFWGGLVKNGGGGVVSCVTGLLKRSNYSMQFLANFCWFKLL